MIKDYLIRIRYLFHYRKETWVNDTEYFYIYIIRLFGIEKEYVRNWSIQK